MEVVFPHWDIKIFIIEKRDDYNYKYDHELMIRYLKEYTYSINSLIHYRGLVDIDESFAYGIETYDVILDYMEALIDGVTRLDIRPFHIMWEHKKCMTNRLKYLLETGCLNNEEILEQYKLLENEALVIRNVILKYQVAENKDLLLKVKNMIQTVKELDSTLCLKLLALLGQ